MGVLTRGCLPKKGWKLRMCSGPHFQGLAIIPHPWGHQTFEHQWFKNPDGENIGGTAGTSEEIHAVCKYVNGVLTVSSPGYYNYQDGSGKNVTSGFDADIGVYFIMPAGSTQRGKIKLDYEIIGTENSVFDDGLLGRSLNVEVLAGTKYIINPQSLSIIKYSLNIDSQGHRTEKGTKKGNVEIKMDWYVSFLKLRFQFGNFGTEGKAKINLSLV